MDVKELLDKNSYKFDDLLEIMRILRSEGGCPWDREQTHKSIRNNFIEETYEFIEGIDKEDDEIMKEELGDVLLQVVFHSRIADEEGRFNIDEVADGVCKKLILRHPHIFGDISVSNSEEVLKNWDEIKKKEKGQKSVSDSIMSVSNALPSLVRASKIQSKAAKVGFDFKDSKDALSKVYEEISEVEEALAKGDTNNIFEEFGDLLFAVVNAARLAKVNSEEALYFANDKFSERFMNMERLAKEENLNLFELDINKLDTLWEKSKKISHN